MDCLLISSNIFDGSSLIDRINQSYIDLELNPSQEEVDILLKEQLLVYLEKNLDNPTAESLFSLISSCLKHFPSLQLPIFNMVFPKSQTNSNFIIITASIMSNFTKQYINQDMITFSLQALDQLKPQIKKGDQVSFKVFGHEISNIFIPDFIIDLLSVAPLTTDIITDFYTFLFSFFLIQDDKKIMKLVLRALEFNLSSILPQKTIEVIFCNNSFSEIPIEYIDRFLLNLTETNFKLFYKKIDKFISNNPSKYPVQVKLTYIQRCCEYNVNIISIEKLISTIERDQISIELLNKVRPYNFKLPYEKVIDLIGKIDDDYIVKIIPSLKYCDKPPLNDIIFKCNDIKSYKCLLSIKESPETCEFVFKQDFWNHLFEVASSCKNLTDRSIQKVALFLKKMNNYPLVKDICKKMILSMPVLTKNGIYFIRKLANYLKSYNIKILTNFLIEKLLENFDQTKTIPIPFYWQLIPSEYLYNKLKQEQKPLYLYGYEFSSKKLNYHPFDINLSIMKQNDDSLNKVRSFLQQESLNYFVHMNEEALSLISCAFIFTSNIIETTVNELTNENFLPFLALCCKSRSKRGGKLKLISNEILSLFWESISNFSNNENPLLIVSMNTILSSYSFISKDSSIDVIYQIINKLSSLLFENKFKADKLILLSAIFQFSNTNPHDNLVQSFFNENCDKLIEFILMNITEIVNNDKLKSNKLNFEYFDDEKVLKKFFNFSTHDFSNVISFLENNCINISPFEIDESILINQNIEIISKFNQKLQSKTEKINENEIDSLLSLILNSKAPENNTELFKKLFDFLMKDEAIAIDYFTIVLNQIPPFESRNLTAEKLLRYIRRDDLKYLDIIITAFSRLFIINPDNKSFHRKLEYKGTFSNYSKSSSEIILKLLKSIQDNPYNFKSFYCLKNIACSFPFLFSENPQQIIDLVLPFLDVPEIFSYYKDVDYLNKERKNKEEKNKLKTLICALTFFQSTLYSIKVLEYFFDWFSKNISELSDSQAFFFIKIMKTLNIKSLLVLTLKNDLFNKCKQLLNRNNIEITAETFNLLTYYYISLNEAPEYIKIIADMLNEVPNPLFIINDHFPILSCEFSPLFCDFKLPYKDGKSYILKIFHFYFKTVCRTKKFYFVRDNLINWYHLHDVSSNEIDDFLSRYNEHNKKIPLAVNLFQQPQVPEPLTSRMIRHVAFSPRWIFNYIYYEDEVVLYPNNVKLLNKIIDELREIQNNDEDEIYEIRLKEFYQHQDEVLDFMIQNNCFHLIDKIVKKQQVLDDPYTYLDMIFQILDLIYYQEELKINVFYNNSFSFYTVSSIISILHKFILFDCYSKDDIEQFVEKLLNVILLPRYRNITYILKKAIDFFVLQNIIISNKRFVHLICFELLNNDTLYINTISLSQYVDKKTIEIAYPFYEINFIKMMEKKSSLPMEIHDKIVAIYELLKRIPIMAKTRLKDIYDFLSNYLSDNLNTPSYIDCIMLNYQHVPIFSLILNLLAPKRSEFEQVTLSDSIMYEKGASIIKQKSKMRPVPEYLSKNSSFWKFISDNYDKFMIIYENDQNKFYEQYSFFLHYPEIVDFQKRSTCFMNQMSKKIVFKNLYIYPDREDILESSFQQLNSRKIIELLYCFSVKFINEREAVDYGGVQRDWMTNLIKEIINPKNNLFISTDTQNYYPNPFSNVKPNHLSYFEFAGKMIATALIHGICVDVHLAPFFFKHILHHKIKFADLKGYNDSVYNSFCYILENDVEELDMKFEIDIVENGTPKTIDLIENGSKIKVTNENKNDFINESLQFILVDSFKEQSDAFCKGFNSLISTDELSIFSQGELELLICGIPKIDIDDMRKNTRVYSENNDLTTINCFFNVIRKWDNDLLAKLIQFITGNSAVPLNGFKEKSIIIQIIDDPSKLPQAHTCFNILDLPDYKDEEILNEKLLIAINECNSFGFI
ncbi:hypothetical protein M9Y10_027842 [Tritrichomonas musculus]|uniref:HECT-type E3 ubiquitin transferase n=1 Tax=Tritrichomonas musculus TaxID=1915356 RepID=A0ABR2H4B1_9EUKA